MFISKIRLMKLLILMEKGIPTQHQGKSLSEIEVYLEEYVDKNEPESSQSTIIGQHTGKKEQNRAWSVDEIAAIKKHFANNLKEGRYPSKSVMEDFIDSSQSKRSVPQVRAKLQHLMRQSPN
nr:unnamed protein product [Callosobruchus analis]